ncbi:hypothetical protein GCM10028775_48720 [Catellatospora paridis]
MDSSIGGVRVLVEADPPGAGEGLRAEGQGQGRHRGTALRGPAFVRQVAAVFGLQQQLIDHRNLTLDVSFSSYVEYDYV